MDFANDLEIKYAHDILLGGLPYFDEEKIKIIKCNDSKDIKACPGSGKTTTLLAKLAILAKRMPFSNGKGICVLTHTNVAIDEIRSKLDTQSNILFSYPNYFGTIQGFVDKFLTIPYYNSIANKTLSIIDDEKAEQQLYIALHTKTFDDLTVLWGHIKDRIPNNLSGRARNAKVKEEQKRLLFNAFYDVNSDKYYREYGASQALASNRATSLFQLLEDTRGLNLKEGILKYEDAYSYALAYAKQCKILKAAISERFSHLFIDEMQDTSAIQYDLIGLLFDPSNVIIQRFGDPHQNIFEHGKMKWNPQKDSLPINISNRFGDNIARVLRAVCEVDNNSLKGNINVPSLKPILLVYNDPKMVLPHFAQLLKERTIGGKSILEIATSIKNNKSNIKAIGWVGKDKHDETYKISSYYPEFEQRSKTTSLQKESRLYNYLRKTDCISIKFFTDQLFSALALILELSGINYFQNGKPLRYTKSRVQTIMKNKFPEEYQILRSNISRWATTTLNSSSIVSKTVYEQVKNYIDKDFQNLFKFENTSMQYLEFTSEPPDALYRVIKIEDTRQNIYIHDDVEIEVATVHSVKGETHIATLYMETSFRGKCESQL